MTWGLFIKIIDEISETDKEVRVWMVFFGEALLLKRNKPSIYDKITYAKRKGLSDVVVHGLEQSLKAQEKEAEAAAIDGRFEKAWPHADVTLTASGF